MAIRRTRTNLEDHYTQLDNEWLRDGRLSLKARGLFAQILSHREGWSISIASLVRANPEGTDAIRSALNELIKYGYLVRGERERDEAGRLGDYEYTLWAGRGLPTLDSDEPASDDPASDNPTPKKNISKKNISKNPPSPPEGETDALFEDEDVMDPFEELFEEVWKAYPSYRRGTKKVARRSLKTAIKAETPERILSALRQHAEDWATWPPSDHQFVPMLSTWLNQERWTAERPGKRGPAATLAQLNTEHTKDGQPAPYGLTPGGRPMGPPPGPHEHPRSPYLGMYYGANRAGTLLFNRRNPMSTRTPSEWALRILGGDDD